MGYAYDRPEDTRVMLRPLGFSSSCTPPRSLLAVAFTGFVGTCGATP